ncbi:HAD family hydrolase [Clostridium sp. SYSU_GA19001]|uniref:HAD family hydrolase n=1 Tax=Clostridium caldaquaticum TaxID=2940653 RepID=UPI002076EC23|nr:HAD family hydrolase [Clostridium caldaquaticum]MCM8711640.1 HAD family hydrolase [Clostridium caldaquaticum]
MRLNNINTIFFDYDGTLHNSVKIYAPAFRKAYEFLVKEGLAEEKEWSDKEISYFLGFNAQDMWKIFMPNLSDELREKCSSIIGTEMKLLIEKGKPILYEGALETLGYLKNKGYHLVFISNCNIYYKECHSKLFKLDRYFETLICSHEYDFIPKYEILKAIKNNYPYDMVIVGDRKQDIEAGRKNNIYTIGCTYGFALDGELAEADILIDSIKELIKFL